MLGCGVGWDEAVVRRDDRFGDIFAGKASSCCRVTGVKNEG